MRPSKRLLSLVAAWLALAGLVFAVRIAAVLQPSDKDLLANASQSAQEFANLWWLLGGVLLVAAWIDAVRQRRYPMLRVVRQLPHSLALGAEAKVSLRIENGYDFSVQLELTDYYPAEVETQALPIICSIEANAHKNVDYLIRPIRRGAAEFGKTHLRIESRWRLWQKRQQQGELQSLKIYPNFAPIAKLAMMGLEHQLSQLGVHLQQRRGDGSDFHQLREFREGDAIRQIDWKATARHSKAISRDYQDERDQSVIFLLDCGRRLRNKDDEFSHFDHALNALLLTSYVALRQGDAVGLMTFAGEERWLNPVKGPANINVLLNQLYDLHSGTTTSDYVEAAERLVGRYSKRSLVILITNVQEEDSDDLNTAIGILTKRHLVVVASLQEAIIQSCIDIPVKTISDALSYCGANDHLEQRRKLLHRLQNLGVGMTDAQPQHLHHALLAEYLRLKRSGKI